MNEQLHTSSGFFINETLSFVFAGCARASLLCEGAVARDGDGLKNSCNTFPVEDKERRRRLRRRLRGKWWGSWGSDSHVSVARICLSTVSLSQIVGRPVTASISRLSVTTILFLVRVYLCVVLSSLSPPTLWICLSKSFPFIFCRPELLLGHERDLFWSLCFFIIVNSFLASFSSRTIPIRSQFFGFPEG